MFSDIAGYTATMGRDEAAGLDARNSHRDLLRAILPRFNGRLIGDLGDGALSSFESAIEAVNCARALQSATGSDRLMALHIGIHVGDVLFSENTVLGDGVNIASRIVALAPAGKICISDRVYEDVRNHRGISATSLRQKHLKNVDRPIGVYVLDDAPETSRTAVGTKATIAVPRRLAIFGAGAIAIAVVAYFVVSSSWRIQNVATEPSAKPHPIRSIAVLPLDNYSGDPAQEYFAEGLTDELTTDLAGISHLRVISRGSTMRFKGENRPPTPEIAKLLDVDAVIEGSVLRVGDRVRITAQLIDAPNDRHMWAKSFERDSKDVLTLEDELASAIAKEIDVQLTPSEQERLGRTTAVNPEAHDAYLKGRYFFSRPSDENLTKAIDNFNEAIRLDPNFAPAYSGLSDAYLWVGVNEGIMSSAQAAPKVEAAAKKALQLDDGLAEAHASLALYIADYEFDWAGAEREFRRAIELDPNYSYAHDQFGLMLGDLGRFDEGLHEGRIAQKLDPLAVIVPLDIVFTLTWQKNYDGAQAELKRALELDPDFYMTHWIIGWSDLEQQKFADAIPELQKAGAVQVLYSIGWLGYAYAAAGDSAKAAATLDDLDRRAARGFVPPFDYALVYLGMGDRNRAIDFLERAVEARSQWLIWLKMDRVYDPLRSEPRFKALMKKLNFDRGA